MRGLPAAALDSMDVRRSWFDAVIEWLLIALLGFMPFVFGAVEAWSEEIVVALSSAIVVCFLLKLIYHHDEGIVWTWAYLPIGIFLFIVVLQLVPLPSTILKIISPNTVSIRTELLNDFPGSDSSLGFVPLSLYPNATKRDLRLVLAVSAVFVVIVNVFRKPLQIKRLLISVALIGGFVSLIALAQDFFGNGKIYWLVNTRCKGVPSGPFVNHSHYGQFMNLSIGAALGLVAVKLHMVFSHKNVTPFNVFSYLSSPIARGLWLLAGIVVIGTMTIFTSLTRGGMVSMLIAFAFTILMVSVQSSLKKGTWVMVVMALAAFSCVLYIGFDAVYERLASLHNLHEYECRWQILKDLTVSFARFPVLGTGLGTHSVVYPMFDNSNIAALATHAENEYAQVMEETGTLGLGALIFLGVVVWSNYVRSIRNTALSVHLAAYGLGFGLLAVLIHSLSDFGQHIPANAFLSAVFCALLISLSHMGQNSKRAMQKIKLFKNSKSAHLVVFTAISGIWLWSLIGANNARLAESNWQKVLEIEQNLVEKSWKGTDTEYADLISFASRASSYQPENIKYRYWLNVYRWRSISQEIDPETDHVLISEDSIPVVQDIVEEFRKACAVCPTFGATYCVLGQIEKFIFGDTAGAENIRKGFSLAPCDPIACFAAGCLDIEEGKIDQSIVKFEKAVQLDGGLFKDIVNIYLDRVDRPDLAISLSGDDVNRLNYVRKKLTNTSEHGHLIQDIDNKMKVLLEEKCSETGAPAWAFAFLAGVYCRQKNNEAALECYRRALSLDYSQVYWRLGLAELLVKMGQKSEAIHEARICLRFRPAFRAAEKLIANLSVHTDVLAGGIGAGDGFKMDEAIFE